MGTTAYTEHAKGSSMWLALCSLRLSQYFYSGWALLLPYLGLYLIYAAARLPVTPQKAPGSPPCLLHVYWFLHAVHLLLGLVALICRGAAIPHYANGLTARDEGKWSCRTALLPWLGLALLIVIPGLYLEFPSDPTAHLGRIVEWAQTEQVSASAGWLKSSYFLAYSFAAMGPPAALESLLTLYYTAMCLQLSWQHYRLALEMKLGIPAAFLFAALQLVVYGNSGFSYHRYYGLSSTIVSQIASIALLRIALHQLSGSQWTLAFGRTTPSLLSLLLLVVFNHIQGLLITAVGLAALGLWWLSRHHRTALIALGVGTAVGSLALLARGILAPSKSLTILQEAGWLNIAGGFNLFEASSPARHRVLELIGTLGLGSWLLGLFMFRRNHPGAWLLTMPLAFLVVPITAYPLALYLFGEGPGLLSLFHSRGLNQMSVFSRVLFAMPMALPVAWLFSEVLAHPRRVRLASLIPLAMIAALLALPPTIYNHARLWQALARTPTDLELQPVRQSVGQIRAVADQGGEKNIVGGSGTCHLLGLMGAKAVPYSRRLILYPEPLASSQIQQTVGEFLNTSYSTREFLVVLPIRGLFFSPGSQSAQLSRHWLPQETALNTAGSVELAHLSQRAGFRIILSHPWLELLTNIPQLPPASPSVLKTQSALAPN